MFVFKDWVVEIGIKSVKDDEDEVESRVEVDIVDSVLLLILAASEGAIKLELLL